MRIVAGTLAALALAAGLAAPIAPVAAAPLHVIVRAHPLYLPPVGHDAYGTYYGNSLGLGADPLDRYYDPAGQFPDWHYSGPPAVDLVLAVTLDRNGESMLGHMLTCQARHATYNPATNMYFGRHGIPQPCYE